MFQTFAFTAGVLLCGVGYALYKKVIQMLKDIDEKYEGKLKTLVFELKVKHQVSINQLLKDIDAKYELKVNHQESIQKLENTIEYNLEHTETLAIDLNNKFRLLKNELSDKVKDELEKSIQKLENTIEHTETFKTEFKTELVLLEDKIKDELILSEDKVKTELVLLEDKIKDKLKEDLVLSEDKVKNELETELLNKVKNELEIKDQENIQTLKTKEFENALAYCGVGDTACHMPRFFDDYSRENQSVLTHSRDTRLRGWSENMVHCFNSTERIQQLNRSDFCVKCQDHYGENEKYCGAGCSAIDTPCGKFIRTQLQDATIIEINNKKYILSKFICTNKCRGQSWQYNEKRFVYNMTKAFLFNYEPDFNPKLEDKDTTYNWYQVGTIDRITKEIIWEPNHEPKLEPKLEAKPVPIQEAKLVPIQEPSPEPVLKIRVNRINIFGKKYFKTTTDGIIYDADTMNEVGKQDQITGKYNINLNKPIKIGKLEDINNIIIL